MEAMQLFLLTIGLTLFSVVQAGYINPVKCATTDKLLGNWYIVRWAGNLPLSEEKLRSPLPPFTFTKNKIGYLEFRMNISKPIGCVEFKMALKEAKGRPCGFTAWMWHYISILLVGGENFGFAYLNTNSKEIVQKMVMLMGRRNHTASLTMLKDFETVVIQLSLNKTSIIIPPYDDSCEQGKES